MTVASSHFPPERRAAAGRHCLIAGKPHCGYDGDGPDCLIGNEHGLFGVVRDVPGRVVAAQFTAALVAAARYLPDALAEIERLEAENAALRAQLAADDPEVIALDERYCDHCETETVQRCRDSNHERDSSGDWRECLVCGWTYWGLTGRYEPPAADTPPPGQSG